ncbi:hypothetical protein ACIA8O_02955 [Kitasatospora sp. NPDC051853]|uniref:hypothetical protein n=1 Tax=Kitasatospora sp. NPDC051853 TaxID=3364058 RepID=UPI003792A940
MPRSRPGALRTEQHAPRVWNSPPPERIHGLSTRTSLAIHRVEELSDDPDVFPSATDTALRRYRSFLRPGRRPLYPELDDCGCPGCSLHDVRHARDVLDAVLERLPHRARAELIARIAPLDARYLARTLPDPFAYERQWYPQVWWRRRIAGGQRLG